MNDVTMRLIDDYQPFISALQAEYWEEKKEFDKLVEKRRFVHGVVKDVETSHFASIARIRVDGHTDHVLRRSGDFVAVSRDASFSHSVSGVILSDYGSEFEIVFEPEDSPRRGKHVFILPQDMTQLVKKRKQLLENVRGRTKPRYAWLDDFLRGRIDIGPPEQRDVELYDKELNEYQSHAVMTCLGISGTSPFHLVLGPPGTGKTTVITEIVRHMLDEGKRILVTAHTHVAIDNMLEKILKLCPETERIALRFGHVGKITPAVRKISVSEKRRKGGARMTVGSLFAQHRLYGATLLSGIQRFFGETPPDVIIMDEASQADLSLSLLALEKAPLFILVGDPYQLPPILKFGSREVLTSLFEMILDTFPQQFRTMLAIQYRSNEKIMEYSSINIYQKKAGQKLLSHESVANALLPSVPTNSYDDAFRPFLLPEHPVVWMDTVHLPEHEWENVLTHPSAYNLEEAALVTALVEELRQRYKAEQIGVICPFRAQANLLNKEFSRRRIDIKTVDSFQGREKDIIIFDLVGNVPGVKSAVYKDERRLNVALTRARRKLIIVGSSFIADNYPRTYGVLARLIRSFTPELKKYAPNLPDAHRPLIDKFRRHVSEGLWRKNTARGIDRRDATLLQDIHRSDSHPFSHGPNQRRRTTPIRKSSDRGGRTSRKCPRYPCREEISEFWKGEYCDRNHRECRHFLTEEK